MFSPEGYQALRHAAGLVRRTDLGVLSVSGADRLTWLQGLVTNDVLPLTPGTHCEASYLTPQGRMMTDLRVLQRESEALLELPAPLAARLGARLDSLIFSEDAQVTDISEAVAVIDVHGPHAKAIVDRALQADEWRGRIDSALYGVPGVTLFVPRETADSACARLAAAGAIETTLDTLDVVRVESGRPKFLADMDEHTIPLEAGIEGRSVSFTKGCYVGQEVIVRIVHRGQGRVARKLVGLLLAEGDVAAPDARVQLAGREVGRLTSVVHSPALNRIIALGYMHREVTEPGTIVTVRSSGIYATGAVAMVPFVEPLPESPAS